MKAKSWCVTHKRKKKYNPNAQRWYCASCHAEYHKHRRPKEPKGDRPETDYIRWLKKEIERRGNEHSN